MAKRTVLCALTLVGLSGCASYEVVQLPLREAELYPLSQTKGPVTVAVDEIGNPQRATKYFGVDLIEQGILPVNITVSNHGDTTHTVRPADVLLRRHTEVIDPLPVQRVTAIAKDSSFRFNDETEAQIEDYFAGLAFTDTILSPHDSYQGVLFFDTNRPRQVRDTLFRAIMLFKQGNLRLQVVDTDLDTQERTVFGPFPLSQRVF